MKSSRMATLFSPRVLKIIAVLLLILALFFVWLGYSAQQHNAQAGSTLVTADRQYSVWRLQRDLAQGMELTKDDVQLIQVDQVQKNEIQDLGLVVGKRMDHAVFIGTTLTQDMFMPIRPIIDDLPPHYRAVAVKANEIVSVGGHIKAGDIVDILYLLKPNRESGLNTTVRRLATNIQVLAVGEQVFNQKNEDKKKANVSIRSVVLAVNERLAPKIMLADSSGELRLAVVGEHDLWQPTERLNSDEPASGSTNLDLVDISSADLRTTQSNNDNGVSNNDSKVSNNNGSIAQQHTPSPDYLVELKEFSQITEVPKVHSVRSKKSHSPERYIEIIQGDKSTWVKTTK